MSKKEWKKRIGIKNSAKGVKVRGINHFTECLIANHPEYSNEDCTCWNDSP